MDESQPLTSPGAVPGPPHLADPRAVQILSTEHWSLLTARSLTYNEAFTRGGMFLTLLSASLLALGFVYQGGGGGGPDFPLIVVAVLSLDLFVGIATLGRLILSSDEEFRALQAMNRIRHAYLEMVPTLDPYISTPRYDDIGSVLSVYGASTEKPRALLNFAHGLTTMPGMVSVIDSALVGGLAAALTVWLSGDERLALVAGLVGAFLALAAFSVMAVRVFTNVGNTMEVRFPDPRRGWT